MLALLGLLPYHLAPNFEVLDDVVLRGDPLGVRIVGLEPGQSYTLSADRVWGREPTKLYRSNAKFVADASGTIDLDADAPIDAAWEGVDPNGLLWSMTPTELSWEEGRSSNVVRFSLDLDQNGEPDMTRSIQSVRYYESLVYHEEVSGLDGAFIVRPESDTPLPSLIVMGGSEGGDRSARDLAPRFASRGFVVMGLPYYEPRWGDMEARFPSLPESFHNLPIELVASAAESLRMRDDVLHNRVGLYGVSKGAELALLAGAYLGGFDAIAAIVPTDVVWEGWGPGTESGQSSGFSFEGEPLPFLPYEGMNAEFTKPNPRLRTPHDQGRLAFADRIAAARIPTEEIEAPVFLVAGGEDDIWDSYGMAQEIVRTRQAANLVTETVLDAQASHYLSGDGATPETSADGPVVSKAFRSTLGFFDRYLKG